LSFAPFLARERHSNLPLSRRDAGGRTTLSVFALDTSLATLNGDGLRSSASLKDVFVHISAVEKPGLSNLNEGRLSNTRRLRIKERHRLKISRRDA